MDAHAINTILWALRNQSYFKTLAIHDNELNSKSVDELANLLRKKVPQNLDSLRISHCKMNLHDTHHLLNTIKTRCNLKTLDLIKVNLNSESI